VNKIFIQNKLVKRATALLLLASVLGISLLASSPALHKWLHHDAGTPEHNCAITLFARGQVAAADAAPSLIGSVILFCGIALLPVTLLLPLADYRFSPSRAPPAART